MTLKSLNFQAQCCHIRHHKLTYSTRPHFKPSTLLGARRPPPVALVRATASSSTAAPHHNNGSGSNKDNASDNLRSTGTLPVSKNPSIAELWGLLQPDVPLIAACCLVTIFSVGSFVAGAPILGNLIDLIGSGSFTIRQLVNASAALGGIYILANATLGLQVTLANWIGESVAARVRARLFSALLTRQVAFYEGAPTGAMASWLGQDVEVLQTTVSKLLGASGLRSILETIAILLTVGYMSWPVAVGMAITAPLVVPAVGPLASQIKAASKLSQAASADSAAAADEIVENVKVVRVFENEGRQAERYRGLIKLAHAAAMKVVRLQAVLDISGRGRNTLSLLVALTLGSLLSLAGKITVGTAYSFFVFSYRFAFALSNITSAVSDVSKATGTIARTLTVLDLCEAEEKQDAARIHHQQKNGAHHGDFDSSNSTTTTDSKRTIPMDKFKGNIEFRNVSFQHPSGWKMEDISFTVPAGCTLAIVGPSGGGKTTIAGLLVGLYRYTQGDILIDGVPLSQLDTSWWRQQLGVVEQDPGLLVGSAADIISYGLPDASSSVVKQAAKAAHASQFIENLPKGYDTVIGPGGGLSISGGQRQRLAIARALARNPKVLVLDEATSALDVEMESAVADAISSSNGQCTKVVIAHRLSTVQRADRILVVADGRVVEEGSHSELLQKQNGIIAFIAFALKLIVGAWVRQIVPNRIKRDTAGANLTGNMGSRFSAMSALALIVFLAIQSPIATAQTVSSNTITAPSRLLPGATGQIRMDVTTSGLSSRVALRAIFNGDSRFGTANLVQSSLSSSGKTNKYVLTGTLKAPMIEAIFEDSKSLKWTVERVDGGSLSGERTAAAVVEVTCSDGIYCNGIERLIRGQCVKPTALPCIDPAGDPCASYQCIEATQRCAPDPIGGPSCPTCVSPSCKPSCNKKTCGDDGCGGSCGPPCGGGQFCVQGACQIVTQLGTCAVPDPLFGASGAVVPAGGIVLDVFGDNRNGLDMAQPVCQPEHIAEYVYKFTIPNTVSSMGFEIRMTAADGDNSLDTLLAVHDVNCQPFTLTAVDRLCSDDQTPPGNYASRVDGKLPPGDYTLIATAYMNSALAPFKLAIKFVPNCGPLCEGKFCGSDSCGGSCGSCGTGLSCYGSFCLAGDSCIPNCKGKQCGGDGCGGTCGNGCKNGQVCDLQYGNCVPVKACENTAPVCSGTGSTNQYCGSDCKWHGINDPMPDLVPNTEEEVLPTIKFQWVEFAASSCPIAEGCVLGTGRRLLMKFDTRVHNVGTATFYGPDISKNPQLFVWASCHQHYHFQKFAKFNLLSNNGTVLLPGAKLSYCMEDTIEAYGMGSATPCSSDFTCASQGIYRMRTDLYDNTLDCQWLDLTDFAAKGCWVTYEVCTNLGRTIFEATYDNNCVRFPLYIPAIYPDVNSDAVLTYTQAVAAENPQSFYPGCKQRATGSGKP